MLGLACDNASPNDVLTNILGERVANFEGTLGRVRCFAHVINLGVKAYCANSAARASSPY